MAYVTITGSTWLLRGQWPALFAKIMWRGSYGTGLREGVAVVLHALNAGEQVLNCNERHNDVTCVTGGLTARNR